LAIVPFRTVGGMKISAALTGKRSNVLGKKLPPQSKAAKKKINENTQNRWMFGAWECVPVSKRKDRILLEQNGCCGVCRMKQEWEGKYLAFEMDHVSGNKLDNSRENLRMICPNCHRQTPTWGARNASDDGKIRMMNSGKGEKHKQLQLKIEGKLL